MLNRLLLILNAAHSSVLNVVTLTQLRQESWLTARTGSEKVRRPPPPHIPVSQLSARLKSQPRKYPDAMQCLKPWRINYTHTYCTHTRNHTQMHLLSLLLSLRHTLCLHREQMQVCLTPWCRGKDIYIIFLYIYIQRRASWSHHRPCQLSHIIHYVESHYNVFLNTFSVFSQFKILELKTKFKRLKLPQNLNIIRIGGN